MGPTGSGKSTVRSVFRYLMLSCFPYSMNILFSACIAQFINTAAGQEHTTVGHDLRSCTAEIVPVCVAYPAVPDARVVFIDTPGFDDTNVSDITILERVSEWLVTTSAFRSCKMMLSSFPADTRF